MKSSYSSFCAVVMFGALVALAAAQPNIVLRHSNPSSGTLRAVAVGSSRLVAVGDNGLILSSPDGETWTQRDSGATESLFGVVFSNTSGPTSLFVAVGDKGKMLKSFDGDTWTAITVPGVDARLNHVSVYGGRIFAAGEKGTIVTSIDGTRWTICQSGTTVSLRAIGTLNTSEVFAVGADGMALLGRYDGENLRPISLGVTADLQTMIATYGAGGLLWPNVETIAVGANGAYVLGTISGSVGRQFTSYSTPTSATLRGVAIGRTNFIVVGDRGSILMKNHQTAASEDWTTLTSGTVANLHGVACRLLNESSSFFIVGENELILQIEERNHAWLNNLSIRAEGGTGSKVLINGFVLGGATAKPVLLRAAGPVLRAFDIDEPMAAPTLTLFDSTGRSIANNTGWGTSADPEQLRSAAQRVGAFAFPTGSADSALLMTLAPGAYTAQVTDRNGASGIALLELYDSDPAAAAKSKFINISARCFVGAGSSIAIPGVQSRGNRLPRLLIRAVGPGLAQFGVTGVLPDPKIEIIHPESYTHLIGGGVTIPAQAVATNDNWGAQRSFGSYFGNYVVGSPDEVREMSARVRAFPLEEGSKDAALLITISPGTHSIQISGVNGSSGIALIEVYDVSDL